VEGLVAGPIGPGALSSLAELPDPPDGMITVALRNLYFPEPLPGAGVRFYEPTPETEGLFTMDPLEAGAEIPRGDPIEDGVIFVEPGGQARVELVYENPTDETVQFESTIWYTEPVTAKIGLINRCFCDSVPFTAPANGAWYRTIWIDFARDMQAGTKMAIVWYVNTDPNEWPLLPGRPWRMRRPWRLMKQRSMQRQRSTKQRRSFPRSPWRSWGRTSSSTRRR
jgi:hypothetical protein